MLHRTLTPTRLASAVGLALALGACGDDGGSVEASAGRTVDPAPADQETVVFEPATASIDDEWPVEVMIPEGWHIENKTFGELEARIRDHDDEGRLSGQGSDAFSIFTAMTFDTGCEGTCEANDWQARLNAPDGWLTQKRSVAELVRDEALPGGWVIVEQDGRDLEANVLLWDNNAARYLKCTVEVDHDDVRLVDQFVDACTAAVPAWFGS